MVGAWSPGLPEVAVTIIFRVLVGVVCDILGARRGLAFLLFLACPGIVGMMSATEQEWMVGSEVEIAFAATRQAVFRQNRVGGGWVLEHHEALGCTLSWKRSVLMLWSYTHRPVCAIA